MMVNEAAEKLGVSSDAIRKAIRRGNLPAEVKYGRLLIRPGDFEAYRKTKRPRGRQVGWRKNKAGTPASQ